MQCKTCKVEITPNLRRWQTNGSPAVHCKICLNVKMYEARKRYVAKHGSKNLYLKHRFNLSKVRYDEILESQDNVCAICKRPERIQNRDLSVDHDHKTDQVRGLLCHNCNLMLGYSEENEDIIWNMLEYLKKYKWSEVA